MSLPPAPEPAQKDARLRVWTRYDRLGASSRLRLMAYRPALEAAGFQVVIEPLLGDAYLSDLYAGRGRGKGGLARAYLRRAASLAAGRRGLLWIEKEALPWLPWLEEALSADRRWKLAIDFDDAFMLRYSGHRSGLVRAALGRKLERLAARADLAICANAALADWARAAGARTVLEIPTVVDLAAYPAPPPAREAGGPARLVWIGTPLNAAYLDPAWPAIAQACAAHGAKLRLIGAGAYRADDPLVEAYPWSEAAEASLIAACDIGLMPLPDTPFERHKSGLKLIQYMAAGLPGVASPVGANTSILTPDCGVLAQTPAEWAAALHRLLGDPALRAAMGTAGRRRAEEAFSLDAWGPRLAHALRALLDPV